MDNRFSKSSKKKTLGSYPYFSVIFSITLALFVIGLFGLLLLHTNHLTRSIRENVAMQVYLNKNIAENDKIKINKLLSSKPYILKNDGRPAIEFISKKEASKQFIKETGEDFSDFLGENPLRDAYNIKINVDYQQVDSLKSIKKELGKINGVFEVVYVESLVKEINSNMAKISAVLLGFSALLLVTIVVLINNTIKLALFSQRFLIRSMQLIGAKTKFIRAPFVRHAAVHGFVSGLIASGLLYGLLFYADLKIPELKGLQTTNEVLSLFGFLLLLGVVIGVFSTQIAVNKYLKMSLDELY